MSGRGEITGVQYLRGLAALVVVVDHAAGTIGQAKYFGSFALGPVLESGRIGADLFFLISGFIITIVSLKGPDLAPAVSVRGFFERRFTRILPLMWVAILSYAAIRLAGPGLGDPGAYLRALFLLPWGDVRPQVIWTLRQELLFYLFFALAMLGPRKLRFIMLLWVLAPLARGFFGPEIEQGPFRQFLFILCHGSAYEFGAGMLIGIVWLKWSRDVAIRLPFEPLAALALAFCLPLGICAVLQVGYETWASSELMALACLPVMLLGVHVVCPDGLGKRIGSLFGNASYSIYLFHPLFLSVIATVAARLVPGMPAGLVVAGAVLVSVAGGILVHIWVERPLIAWARGWFGRAEPAVPQG
jgi:exopolysaccharide production protein ExoZ